MRVTTVTTRSVEDIGYFENGLLKCTSSGIEAERISLTPADFMLANGIGVSLHMAPHVSDGKTMVGLFYRSHKALIDPVRFADVILDQDIELAVALDDGRVLGTMHDPDPALVKRLLAGGDSPDSLHALRRDAGLSALAIEPRSKIAARLRSEHIMLLPLGALMAAFLVGVVVWLSRRRLSPLAELQIAVEQREFVVHYQPIVALKTGVCIGAEALVRWRRPDGAMVRPDLFIPLAEDSGLILPITDQVVAAVIHELKDMLLADRNVHIAVNLCASDIESGRILPVLQRELAGTGIETQQIWLEATERGFLRADAARATLQRARDLGHAVAIDDFGTGYSSLSNLQSLPLDALKIDKSFVDTVGTDAATSSVTPHIIDIAKTLGLQIVAEGIETQAQADYLLARGVEFGQGWLYAKALPADQFLLFYQNNSQS
ncbi:EAL domain protein [Janthinobacterium agaricidamnosum NBRC 102515 = DSM 9628]|uniref:cyclic-guanylate-specific phosphodiesterase n=2 Tax=Janthinobacterium agaricidamnosum TaxID=55508 RepID=W0V7I0_9BURK|nr:EAL domain protein [Janthinobacterium agaricidamnosum NBRC 102515 = DSM 9628]